MESDDEFEYHITFPQTTEKYGENFQKYSGNDPVIILLGWGGCLDKHLAKYSAIYEKAGYATIRYIAPKQKLFSTQSRKYLQPHAEKLVEMLQDMHFYEQGIFFHIFSNGGSLMYDLIQEQMEINPNYQFKILGCMFDSTPARVSLLQYLKAVFAVVPGNIIIKYLITIAALFEVFFHNARIMIYPLFGKNKPSQRKNDLWFNLSKEPVRCSQMFLYSIADEICSCQTIEEFIEIRKSKGVKVKSVKYEESSHVQHFVMYPQSYQDHCIHFIEENSENFLDGEDIEAAEAF